MRAGRLLSRHVRFMCAAASVGLVAATLTACQPQPHSALVVGDGTRVAISQSTIQAGKDSFVVVSNNPTRAAGSRIVLFRLKAGATLTRVAADWRDEFSRTPAVAAPGSRAIVRDIDAIGLADVSGGATATVTANLSAGTYYLTDLGDLPSVGALPIFTPLKVTAGAAASPLHGQFSVQATAADRFAAPSTWPHSGTYLFTNTAIDTLHIMDLQRVTPGTTDAQIQAYFDSNGRGHAPALFLPGYPSAGNGDESPGQSILVTYNLPPGSYVLLCFVADPTTGIEHALTGMHKVITLT
jgi:hypothetical protein